MSVFFFNQDDDIIDFLPASNGGDGKLTGLALARARAAAQQQLMAAGGGGGGGVAPRSFKAVPLSRLASENAGLLSSMGVAGGGAGGGGGPNKPKLIRQSAILADGDSTSSGKSVTFKDVPEENPSTSSRTGNTPLSNL